MRKVTVEQMKEYLWHAMQFEKYVYIWTKAMESSNREMNGIYTERKRLQNKKNAAIAAQQEITEKYAQKSEKDQSRTDKQISELEERIRICSTRRFVFLALTLVLGATAIFLINLLVKAYKGDFINDAATVFLSFLTLIPSIIFMIRFLVDNKRLKNAIKRLPELRSATPKDYSNQENQELAKVDMSISDLDCDLANLNRHEAALTTHQEQVFLELQNAKNILNNIYSLNIIHPDYRDFVAVSTMYGYLDRGRCNKLEGEGGIYDSFEKDMQQNKIIRNLQDLNAAMDRVENNQRVLINQMRIANNHLSSMDKSLRNIDYNTDRIADNTSRIAVASEQSAAELKWQSARMRAWS